MSVHTQLGNTHVVIDGQFVNQRISQIVEAINDYSDGEVEVKYVPEGARREGQAAFALVHNPPGGMSYVMFYVKDEESFDQRVLQRLIVNDQRNGQQQYSELVAWEKTQQLLQKQAALDALEEAHDIAYHVFKTHKNTYRVNKDLVIKEGIPFNAARLKD